MVSKFYWVFGKSRKNLCHIGIINFTWKKRAGCSHTKWNGKTTKKVIFCRFSVCRWPKVVCWFNLTAQSKYETRRHEKTNWISILCTNRHPNSHRIQKVHVFCSSICLCIQCTWAAYLLLIMDSPDVSCQVFLDGKFTVAALAGMRPLVLMRAKIMSHCTAFMGEPIRALGAFRSSVWQLQKTLVLNQMNAIS